jgi:hypothetical protein
MIAVDQVLGNVLGVLIFGSKKFEVLCNSGGSQSHMRVYAGIIFKLSISDTSSTVPDTSKPQKMVQKRQGFLI